MAATLLLGTVACGGTAGAGGIPDGVMLRPDDIDGASTTTVGPDQSRNPLPPAPCGPPATPEESRLLAFRRGPHHVYQYVARPESGAVAALRDAIARCPGAYRLTAEDVGYPQTLLVSHENGAYYVGATGGYLVVVLSVDDTTLAADYGQRAMARAGAKREPGLEMRTPTEAPRVVTFAAEVTAVRPGKDDRTLVIEVRVPECSRDARVTNLDETTPGTVHANVVYDVEQPERCTAQVTRTVTLATKRPLGDRQVVLDSLRPPWARDGAGYRQCTGAFGCATPPADHCAQGWIDVATAGLDVPRHSSREVEHCDQQWLIVSMNETAGACGPVEGRRPGCSVPPRVQRWFLRFETSWQVAAVSREAGCPSGVDVPARLCERLPRPG